MQMNDWCAVKVHLMFNRAKLQLAEFYNDTCLLRLARISNTHVDALDLSPVCLSS